MSETPAYRRRKLSAIMMVDVSGFSRMMGRDEERTVRLIREFQERVERLVKQFEGRVVSTAGDSAFGEFDSVHNAMGCAQAIQESEAALHAAQSPEDRIAARIGVHLGDVIVEDYQVYGDGVNIAARLEPMADPGGICISEAVYQQIRSRLTAPVQDLGIQELKNIEHPIRIYKIPPVAEAAGSAVPVSPGPVSTRVPEPTRASGPGSSTLVLCVLGGFLLLSPLLLFPTAGVLPAIGSIVLAIGAGRYWTHAAGKPRVTAALGVAIVSAALWTNWSHVTNGLFVLAGLIVLAVAAGRDR